MLNLNKRILILFSNMAHCNLFPGIASVSGKLGKVLFKTFTRPDGSSFTRVYSTAGHAKRKSKPSASELVQRQRFARIAAEVARLMRSGDTRPRQLIWREVSQSL